MSTSDTAVHHVSDGQRLESRLSKILGLDDGRMCIAEELKQGLNSSLVLSASLMSDIFYLMQSQIVKRISPVLI